MRPWVQFPSIKKRKRKEGRKEEVWMHACNSSYLGGKVGASSFQGSPRKVYLKEKLKAKGLGIDKVVEALQRP
jgi:hypothetical protein